MLSFLLGLEFLLTLLLELFVDVSLLLNVSIIVIYNFLFDTYIDTELHIPNKFNFKHRFFLHIKFYTLTFITCKLQSDLLYVKRK